MVINMKYSVDKIEDNVVVLQNIEDGTIKYINISLLPDYIRETDILVYDGEKFIIDEEEKEKRVESILEKMNRLREVKEDDYE